MVGLFFFVSCNKINKKNIWLEGGERTGFRQRPAGSRQSKLGGVRTQPTKKQTNTHRPLKLNDEMPQRKKCDPREVVSIQEGVENG